MESVERAGVGNELRPFRLKHLPDRLLGQLRMAIHLGMGDAFIEQPSVHLVVGLESQPWREEALTYEPDWFSTWPFSQPDAGVQATGSMR